MRDRPDTARLEALGAEHQRLRAALDALLPELYGEIIRLALDAKRPIDRAELASLAGYDVNHIRRIIRREEARRGITPTDKRRHRARRIVPKVTHEVASVDDPDGALPDAA